jgi:hypothetical protein
LTFELVPFGNFGQRVSVVDIVAANPAGFGAGVVSRIQVKIKATVSCEISAADTNDLASDGLRKRFGLKEPVDTNVTFDFASASPHGDLFVSLVHHAEKFNDGIANVEVDPLHVTVPDNFDYRGFA